VGGRFERKTATCGRKKQFLQRSTGTVPRRERNGQTVVEKIAEGSAAGENKKNWGRSDGGWATDHSKRVRKEREKGERTGLGDSAGAEGGVEENHGRVLIDITRLGEGPEEGDEESPKGIKKGFIGVGGGGPTKKIDANSGPHLTGA